MAHLLFHRLLLFSTPSKEIRFRRYAERRAPFPTDIQEIYSPNENDDLLSSSAEKTKDHSNVFDDDFIRRRLRGRVMLNKILFSLASLFILEILLEMKWHCLDSFKRGRSPLLVLYSCMGIPSDSELSFE